VNLSLPKKLPKGVTKCVVLLKTKPVKVENVSTEILFNEVGGGEPLEYLQRMLAVYVPVLANPALGLGEVTSREMNNNLQNFLFSVTTTVGYVNGETSLPLPPLDAVSTKALTAKERVHLLEECVAVWTKQIKHVLAMDPEASFKGSSHPTPDVELTFWRTKSGHLDSIFQQLQSERLRRVLQHLDSNGSTFCEPFAKLCKEVFAARGEANDNAKFLSTLEPYVRKLNENFDLATLPDVYRPLLHTLLLIWKHSKFYNTSARMVVFMRQVVNSIIAASERFLTGKNVTETLLDENAPTMVGKLQTLLRVAGDFKLVYFRYKAIAATECPSSPWRISNTALFSRLDTFLERCHDVLEITHVVISFRHLEKVIIGGIKGKILSETVEGVLTEFRAILGDLDHVAYDLLYDEGEEFSKDFSIFKKRVEVLERRLATTLVSAFEDAPNLYARCKLLDTYHVLLERPLISRELEKLQLALVREFSMDLRRVHETFLSEVSAPFISKNLPPTAGRLFWSRALRDRVHEPMSRIKSLGPQIGAREETREACKLYDALVATSEQYDAKCFASWAAELESSSDEKLRLSLIRTRAPKAGEVQPGSVAAGGAAAADGEEGGGEGKSGESSSGTALDSGGAAVSMLDTNFDPTLVCLLREVKYLLLLGMQVPPSALEIYKRSELYRRWTGTLDVIVGMHNTILAEMLPVEVPLLTTHLSKMNTVMQRATKELNWLSKNVEEFLTEAMTTVKTAYDILYILKQNLREIVHVMEGWSREPLLTRKIKPSTVEEFEMSYKTARTARYNEIQEGGKMVLKKLKETEQILKLPKSSAGHWAVYVDFVNGVVVQGLQKLVTFSLSKLCDLLSPEKIRRYQELPLLVIELTLQPSTKELKYNPDVHERILPPGAPVPPANQATLYDIVNNWVLSFYHVAKMFKRMDDNEGRYLKEMVDDVEVKSYLAQLAELLGRAEVSCEEFKSRFGAYSYLWSRDMTEELNSFVERSYFELPKNEDQLREESSSEHFVALPQPKVPDLAKFENEISKYFNIGEMLAAIKTTMDLAWLRVNSNPVKNSLADLVSKWSGLYIDHLNTWLVDNVNNLAGFVANTNAGLATEVTADTPANLMKVMGVLLNVKQSRFSRLSIIEPLRSTLKLLKRNGVNLDDLKVSGPGAGSGPSLLVEYLDQAELLLDASVKRSFQKKEEINQLQFAEMEKIKLRAEEFTDNVRVFWNGFKKNAPYNFSGSVDEAYQQLDGFFADLKTIETNLVELNAVEALFELPISAYKEAGDCRGQLKLLKALWDFKGLVLSTYDNWKLALWSEINTDVLDDSNKKMAAELKKIGDSGPTTKAWQVFKDLEVLVKDMSVTLPLINELHSPAMRPRHWEQLANVCKVKSLDPTDSKFSLDDMLVLKLHTHAEESTEIVDTSNKELKIEKKLDEIERAWKGFNLDFVQWKDMDLKVVKASDEVQESLDAHQMELQSIVGMGKVMEFFRARVDKSQKDLGCVEEVLKEWLSVTRNWGSLEVIFLASADIRAQLPDETKIFESIDGAFKELMKAAVDTTNVVEACCLEGRGDALRDMTKKLEMCQRKLNDYLDKKKKIFPRFYFVSNVALLDILSNGNNPPKIMPYLGGS